jgi:hypothetical protein
MSLRSNNTAALFLRASDCDGGPGQDRRNGLANEMAPDSGTAVVQRKYLVQSMTPQRIGVAAKLGGALESTVHLMSGRSAAW